MNDIHEKLNINQARPHNNKKTKTKKATTNCKYIFPVNNSSANHPIPHTHRPTLD